MTDSIIKVGDKVRMMEDITRNGLHKGDECVVDAVDMTNSPEYPYYIKRGANKAWASDMEVQKVVAPPRPAASPFVIPADAMRNPVAEALAKHGEEGHADCPHCGHGIKFKFSS